MSGSGIRQYVCAGNSRRWLLGETCVAVVAALLLLCVFACWFFGVVSMLLADRVPLLFCTLPAEFGVLVWRITVFVVFH